MKDALTYANEAGFFSFNVVGWKAEFERLVEAVRADAVAHEQERCALVCVTLGEYYAECDDFEAEDVALACAASIRESEK